MQLYLSLGILLCFAMSTSLPYYHVALGAAVAVTLFVVLAFWLRETPRWLLANGRAHSAFESLKWFRGPNYDLYGELNTMKLSLSDDNRTGVWKEFRKKYVLVPLVMLLLVFFFQQIGGLNAMGAYGTIIFKDAGVNHPQLASALTMGVSDIVGNVVAGVIVDRMGRKPLLVISGIGMGVGSSLLGIHFYLTRPSQCSSNGVADLLGAESLGATQCNAQYRPLAIVSVIIYNLMFSVGWGPVPWILLPELLPLRVRGIGGGFSILVNWATSALVAGAYLSYSETVTLWFAWWSFALLNFTSIVFVLVALVETRGENLEVIQTAFKKR
jgi:MFS family permease